MNDDQKKTQGRPRKPAAHRAADRQALVVAAFDIVRAGGASALTARSVAARVGAAVGSVYTAFESLDALRLEMNTLTMGLLEDHLVAALARCRDGSVEARLLCLATAYIDFAETHRPIWSALFETRAMAAPPAVALHISGLFALLEGVLRDAGGTGTHDVHRLARALWSSVHGVVYLAEAGGLGPIGREEVPAIVEALIKAVVAGLVPAAPRGRGRVPGPRARGVPGHRTTDKP